MFRFFAPSRREVALDLSRKLQSIVLAISSNDPKLAFNIWSDLEEASARVNSNDFTILRNHFLMNVKVNCEDRLKLSYDFDRWRLAHHVSAKDHIFGYRYYQADLALIPSLTDLKIPPLPESQASLAPAEDESQVELQPQDQWHEAFDHLNAAFFRGQLARPARFSWKELPVLSKSSWLFTDQGIQFHVQLHHRLQSSPLCFGMLLHELIHVWDETTWKPMEPSWTPAGHGIHWMAKAEQAQMALKFSQSTIMINLEDDIPTKPQQQPVPRGAPPNLARRPPPSPTSTPPPQEGNRQEVLSNKSAGFMASLRPGARPKLQPGAGPAAVAPGHRLLRMDTEPGQAIKAGRYVVDVVPDANRPAA
eukprot:EG_transcript_13280